MITAKTVLKMLAMKHSKDVFVPECKNGPTVSATHLRLDAWAMKRSWTNPLTYGYEIKLSRSDFLQDDKWQQYLGYCAEFYFVSPAKVIQVEELPAEVGLLWLSTNGTRLFTKRKAARRSVEIPEDLWRYILMCRATIGSEDKAVDRAKKWREWLEDKEQKKDLGRRVGGRIATLVRELEQERDAAKRKTGDYKAIQERISELGFDPNERVSTWQVRSKLDELAGTVPIYFMRDVQRVRDGLQIIAEQLAPDRQEPEGGE